MYFSLLVLVFIKLSIVNYNDRKLQHIIIILSIKLIYTYLFAKKKCNKLLIVGFQMIFLITPFDISFFSMRNE
jgi:hypothetical protein